MKRTSYNKVVWGKRGGTVFQNSHNLMKGG